VVTHERRSFPGSSPAKTPKARVSGLSSLLC
jgi:hypothetical protein